MATRSVRANRGKGKRITIKKVGNSDEIAKQLFYAVKEPLNVNIEGFDSPNVSGIYKDNGGKCLGVVGGVYDILQPTDFYASVLDALVADEKNVLDKDNMIYTELFGGEVISVRIPMPDMVINSGLKVEGKKVNDVTKMYLEFRTGFNGLTSTSIGVYTERLVCTNGMVVKHKEVGSKFKHTENANLRVKLYATQIYKSIQGLEQYKLLMEKMNQVILTDKQYNDLVKEITGYEIVSPLEVADMHANKRKNYEAMMESIDLEMNRLDNRTAYGLLQGITHFTNHKQSAKSKATSFEYTTMSTGLTLNDKAQTVLTKFVNA